MVEFFRKWPLVSIFFLFGFQLLAQPADSSQKVLIYQYQIFDEIAKPAWLRTKKAFKEAQELKADYVLLHLNTYGGALDAADSIRTIILNSKIPVMVFIDNNAASAGALISIACDSIYMRKGASIGAATVVNQTGEAAPDKYQSYMRSIMRSTAESTGRNPDIAQAMVDPHIHVLGVNDSGQVITFTPTEAMKHGFCNGMAENITEVLQKAEIKNYEIKEQQLSVIDYILAFLTSPIVAGILIMVIIGGIYIELQAPGIGLPGALALIAAVLYFAPHYLEGLAANWEILVFIVGVILLALEIFVIPGFGVAGVSGIVLMVFGLAAAMLDNTGFDFGTDGLNAVLRAFTIVIAACFAAFIGSFYISKKLFTQTTIFGTLALDSEQRKEEGFSAADSKYAEMVGRQGVAHTILRPSGKVMIEGRVYDAIAQISYIEKGEAIEVVKYETTQLVVRKLKIEN